MFTVRVIKQLLVYICSVIYCSGWTESPTCYFSKYFGPNAILFDGMTITGIKGRQMIPRRLECSDIYSKHN